MTEVLVMRMTRRPPKRDDRFELRIEPGLKSALEKAAREEDRTVAGFIRRVLIRALEERRGGKK